MKKIEVVMVGTPCIDKYYQLDSSPSLGDKSSGFFSGYELGGMISNAAVVSASYGMETALITQLNRSRSSRRIIRGLTKKRVNTSLITTDDSIPDGECLIFLHKGERWILVLTKRKNSLTITDLQMQIISEAKALYSTLSEIGAYTNALQVVREARKNNVIVAFDIEGASLGDKECDYRMMMESSILFMNESGAHALGEVYGPELFEKLEDSGVIVVRTLGANGCKVTAKNILEFKSPAFKVNPVDTTGAGDTFNTTFIYGLLKNWPLERCARVANGAAGRAITVFGAQSGACDIETVLDFIGKYKQED